MAEKNQLVYAIGNHFTDSALHLTQNFSAIIHFSWLCAHRTVPFIVVNGTVTALEHERWHIHLTNSHDDKLLIIQETNTLIKCKRKTTTLTAMNKQNAHQP